VKQQYDDDHVKAEADDERQEAVLEADEARYDEADDLEEAEVALDDEVPVADDLEEAEVARDDEVEEVDLAVHNH